MNIDDVRAAIAASDKPYLRVWIGEGGKLPGDDNVAVLVREPDGTWLTAYFERGSYQYPEIFATQDEACRGFLELVGIPLPGQPT